MKAKHLLSLLLVCLFLTPATLVAADPNPSVLTDALRGTPYEGYTLSCQTFAAQYEQPGNSSAYAIATGGGKNVLCAFVEAEDGWHLHVSNENALPDDPTQLSITIVEYAGAPAVSIKADTVGGSTQVQFIINGYDTNASYSLPLFEVLFTVLSVDGGTPTITRVAPSEETGKWTVTENGEYQSYENRAYARMDDFDLRDIPLTRAAADAIWHDGSSTIYIEADDRRAAEGVSKLSGQQVTLPGDQMIPVYSGPDMASLRGADGKAAVSTKEPVNVYATNHDWVLISYGIPSGERYGYIPLGHMPADISIPLELTQGAMSMGVTTREVGVLDNLSTPDAPLCVLPYQTPLEVFATLGDWLYVGVFSDLGFSCRGFIPIDALHHTNNF